MIQLPPNPINPEILTHMDEGDDGAVVKILGLMMEMVLGRDGG